MNFHLFFPALWLTSAVLVITAARAESLADRPISDDAVVIRMMQDPHLAARVRSDSSLDLIEPRLPLVRPGEWNIPSIEDLGTSLPVQAKLSPKPMVLLADNKGILRIVTDRENPALCGSGCDGPVVGAMGRSPLCPSNNDPPTRNRNALDFVSRFPPVPKAIAGIVWRREGHWRLMGTAVLAIPNAVVSAGHVIRLMQDRYGVKSGHLPVSQEGFFIVFDLTIARFPSGIPDATDFSTDATAVEIKVGAKANSSSRPDVGVVRLPLDLGRATVEINPDPIPSNRELALVGVPGRPAGGDATDPDQYRKNYGLCGVPDPSAAVVLRVGTGKFLGYDGDGPQHEFRFHIDTLGGNSGSAVLDAESGRMVGVNVGTLDNTDLKFNLAVSSTIIQSMLARL